MSDDSIRTQPAGMTRRSMLGHGFAAIAVLGLAACGGESAPSSAREPLGDASPGGVNEFRFTVWRDPG